MKRPVSEVMTRDLVVLTEEENLLDVARDMNRYHLRHLPVVDDGKLVGQITRRDIVKKIESSMEYPGQVKVVVTRETRVSFASSASGATKRR